MGIELQKLEFFKSKFFIKNYRFPAGLFRFKLTNTDIEKKLKPWLYH